MKEMLDKASKEGYAVGAFNIVNFLTAQAVVDAAQELKSPLILQTSTSTVKQIGIQEMAEMLIPIAKRATVPVAIHLDHCTDVEFVKKCVDAGWSSVMIDASKQPLEENIRQTKEIVDYTKGKNVTVEGELGAIVGVEDEIVVKDGEEAFASVEQSREYLSATNIDAFAPAIGTAHGLYKGEPRVDFNRFQEIKAISPCPVVIHGGTGLAPEVFKKLIVLGATKINISTAIKIAYCGGMKDYTTAHPEENNPLKLDKYVIEQVKKVAKEHMMLFGSVNRV
jgi:fructose-bisphosphate aldolase class II